MIKLATVFSGIGAIEHALERMGLEYKIVFACDNGDVDILTKDIGMNIDDIRQELSFLGEVIDEVYINDNVEDLYKNQLRSMISEAYNEYHEVEKILKDIDDNGHSVKSVLEIVISQENLSASRKKEYEILKKDLSKGSVNQKRLKEFQTILEIINDFNKENQLNHLGSETNAIIINGIIFQNVSDDLKILYEIFEKHEGKKIIRNVQDLTQRTSQLHEKINYLKIQKELELMGDKWSDRKAYVDSLYVGLEKRNKVKQSYMANYELQNDDFHWNAAFLDGRQYTGQVDLFVGGSPCQSFSLVGKQRGLDDTRGTLFYEYARLINEIKPKVFIYENVRSVISHDKGKTWKKMQEVFYELGYTFSWSIMNAKNYGIPQNRERLFVVGFRDDLSLNHEFSFPKPIPLTKNMKDFLIDNVPGGYYLPRKGVEFVLMERNLNKRYTQIDGEIQLCQKKNQQFNWHGDFVFQSVEEAQKKNLLDLEKYFLSEKVKKYVLSPGTKNFYSKPAIDLEIARPLLTSMHKMHRAGVDNYVTTEGRLRKLTPRECLRLMGFSDNFKIEVSNTSMYQQAGNSIVVDVLIAIMKQVLDSMDFEEENNVRDENC